MTLLSDIVEIYGSSSIAMTCEVCGRLVWKLWFAPFFGGLKKCGRCATPPRADVPGPFLIHVNDDSGDEQPEETR